MLGERLRRRDVRHVKSVERSLNRKLMGKYEDQV